MVSSCRNEIKIFTDSPSATKLVGTEEINRPNNRIDVKYHFVCDVLSCSEARLEYKPTFNIVVNALTNPLRWKCSERTIKLIALQRKANRNPKLSRGRVGENMKIFQI